MGAAGDSDGLTCTAHITHITFERAGRKNGRPGLENGSRGLKNNSRNID